MDALAEADGVVEADVGGLRLGEMNLYLSISSGMECAIEYKTEEYE